MGGLTFEQQLKLTLIDKAVISGLLVLAAFVFFSTKTGARIVP